MFTAAKLGEVCYSDTHCALSDENNRCQFTMPGVFGFCICDPASPDCIYKAQNSILIKPNSSAFKYPFSKPDLTKKFPYQKRPWQTDDLRLTTTTSTIKPLRPINKPQMPPLKRPIIKTNLTNNGIKFTAVPVTNTQSSVIPLNYTTVASKNITFKPQFAIVPTPSPIKIYLKSPLKDSQNKSQTLVNDSSIKVHKKPISNTGNSGPQILFAYKSCITYTHTKYGSLSIFLKIIKYLSLCNFRYYVKEGRTQTTH